MTHFLSNRQENPKATKSTKLSVWFCESCGCYHLQVGKVVLTFSPKEFAEFSDAVVDCHYDQAWRQMLPVAPGNSPSPVALSGMNH